MTEDAQDASFEDSPSFALADGATSTPFVGDSQLSRRTVTAGGPPRELRPRERAKPSQQHRLGLAEVPKIPSISAMRVLKLAEEESEDSVDPYVLERLKRRRDEEETGLDGDEYEDNAQLEEGEIRLPPVLAMERRRRSTRRRRMVGVGGPGDSFRGPRRSSRGTGKKSFWCWVCSEIFYERRLHKEHLLVEHGMDVEFGKWQRDGTVRSYECTDCGLQFHYPHKLMIHFNQAHAPRKSLPFQCPSCHYRFALHGNLTKHIEKVHGPDRSTNFVCTDCDSGYQSKKEYTKHLRRVHQLAHGQEDDILWCLYCTCSFMIPQNYIDHVTNEHDDEEPQFFCRRCERIYKTPSTFTDHGCPMLKAVEPQAVDTYGAEKRPTTSARRGGAASGAPRTRRLHLKPNNPDYAVQPFYPYRCRDCLQPFQSEKGYIRHITERHGRPDPIELAMSRSALLAAQSMSSTQRESRASGAPRPQSEAEGDTDEEEDGEAEVPPSERGGRAFGVRFRGDTPAQAPQSRMTTEAEEGRPRMSSGSGTGQKRPSTSGGRFSSASGVGQKKWQSASSPSKQTSTYKPLNRAEIEAVRGRPATHRFQCPDCGMKFNYLDDLNDHRTEQDHWGLPEDLLALLDEASPSKGESTDVRHKTSKDSTTPTVDTSKRPTQGEDEPAYNPLATPPPESGTDEDAESAPSRRSLRKRRKVE